MSPCRADADAPAVGLALFARSPADARFVLDILSAMVLLGLGTGVALNPLLLAAMGDVDQSRSGLASGLVNTAFMIGGTLGLAVLASLAAAQTSAASAGGADPVAALHAGYRAAFALGAAMLSIAALLGAGLGRSMSAASIGKSATASES